MPEYFILKELLGSRNIPTRPQQEGRQLGQNEAPKELQAKRNEVDHKQPSKWAGQSIPITSNDITWVPLQIPTMTEVKIMN